MVIDSFAPLHRNGHLPAQKASHETSQTTGQLSNINCHYKSAQLMPHRLHSMWYINQEMSLWATSFRKKRCYMHKTLSGGCSHSFWHPDKRLTNSCEPTLPPQRISQQMWTTCAEDRVRLAKYPGTWQSIGGYSQSSCLVLTSVPRKKMVGDGMGEEDLPNGPLLRHFDTWLLPQFVNRDQPHRWAIR